MKSTYTALMNSKFFNPAFNSALFDGPVRIYFAQNQEAMALKIYFSLQKDFSDDLQRSKTLYKNRGTNILVMIYPDNEAFCQAFGAKADFMHIERLGSDIVLGINGPFEDEKLNSVLLRVVASLQMLNDSQESAAEVASL